MCYLNRTDDVARINIFHSSRHDLLLRFYAARGARATSAAYSSRRESVAFAALDAIT